MARVEGAGPHKVGGQGGQGGAMGGLCLPIIKKYLGPFIIRKPQYTPDWNRNVFLVLWTYTIIRMM